MLCLGWVSGERENWFLSLLGRADWGVGGWDSVILRIKSFWGRAKPSERGPLWVSLHKTPCPAALGGEKLAPVLSGGDLI